MDPEFRERDARAVEDPIAAVFELADSVDRQTPKIRRVLRYARWFVSLWLLLDFFLMIILAAIGGNAAATFLLFFPILALLVGMRYVRGTSTRLALFVTACALASLQALTLGGFLFLGVVLAALFVLGFVILELMGDLRSFFDYFALRHRVILAVRQADPLVHVPQGKDAATRILSYLAASDPQVRSAMAAPGALASPALLTGKSGLTYSFDAVLRSEPTRLTRLLGIGPPGFAVYAKAWDRAPTLDDLRSLKAAVEDVSAALQIPPARVFVLWSARTNETVAADVYEFLTKDTVRARIRRSTYACSLQLVREGDDGTYDFIPVIMEPIRPAARTAAA